MIRQVLLPTSGGPQISADTEEEYKAQVKAYGEKLGKYSLFNIEFSNTNMSINTCGVPHIEIYDPSGQLLIGDSCSEGHKKGLNFLRQWMSDETLNEA